ncbi:MAG TPA: hypothetical protein PL042_04035 [Caldisericia bacterium]|nr:hypothetical protein [Caldisericia bacterium]
MAEYNTGFCPADLATLHFSLKTHQGFTLTKSILPSTGSIVDEKKYAGSYAIRLVGTAVWTVMLNLNSAKDITVQAKVFLKGVHNPTLMMLLYDSNGNVLESATPLTTTGSWQDIQLVKTGLQPGVYYIHFYTKGLGTLCYIDNIEVL